MQSLLVYVEESGYDGGMSSPGRTSKNQQPIARLGVDEGNNAELPAIIAGGHKPGQLTRTWEKVVVRNGEPVRQQWKLLGNEEYGLPTNKDGDVYYALMEISAERGWPRKLFFSLYDLIERMGWNHGGNSYANARESIERWATLSITATNSFYVIKEREYRGKLVWGFIEEAYTPKKEEISDLGEPSHYIVWNEHFYQSIKDGYIFSIDLEVFRELRKRPLARRLYMFLNKRFGNSGEVRHFDLKELAHVNLGVSETRDTPARIRETFDPAVDDLKRLGIVKSAWFKKTRSGVRVYFKPGKNSRSRSVEKEKNPLALLQKRLFSVPRENFKKADRDRAADFVETHGEEAWERFAEWAAGYREERWPDLGSVGGALTLIDKFLGGRDAFSARREHKKMLAEKKRWKEYIDGRIEELRVQEPERLADFEKKLETDSKYRFWLEAANGRGTLGPSANRPLHLEAARDIYRERFIEAFPESGAESFEEWRKEHNRETRDSSGLEVEQDPPQPGLAL